ncbi:MarR family winged helix-turn-helix transcriptional regulator [Streptomyces niger]|uniref:MarR family winged helix-turn-helix transcriptional regulator n=1 Tax=Streptomyces niger TaxID=66373 RepID=UPI000AEAFC55|nr:MarR family transcriptional regulator [Streptomyces niger]
MAVGEEAALSAVGEEATLELVVTLHRLLRSLGRAVPGRRVPPTQLIVLALLTQLGPSRIGVLAERIPCSQPTATAAVASLESAGLVRREPDPTDGRAARVVVTEDGVRALNDVAHSEAEALAARLATLPPEDVQCVLDAGALLRRLAEPGD